MRMLDRRLWTELLSSIDAFRVVILNGPRQSGKSTLLRLLAERTGRPVYDLDDRTTLRTARTDPSGFVAGAEPPCIVDEIQRGGNPLVLAVKAAVDRRNAAGHFVLAGSSQFLTVPTLSESLAGRARILDLLPLSQGELRGGPDSFVDDAFTDAVALRQSRPEVLDRRDVMMAVATGGFPGVHALSSLHHRRSWFVDYTRTLVARDLVQAREVRRLDDVPRLMRLLAARTAQELNTASLARDADLNKETTHNYLALLSTIYFHRVLPPWSTNFTTRAKRRVKVHVLDSGLAAAVLGVDAEALTSPFSAVAGPLLETFVVGELAKQLTWTHWAVTMFHYRDHEGREVDIVLEHADGRVVAIEVKATIDVDETDFRGLRYLRDRLGDRFVHGFVVHIGQRPLPFGDRLTAIPVSALWSR